MRNSNILPGPSRFQQKILPDTVAIMCILAISKFSQSENRKSKEILQLAQA